MKKQLPAWLVLCIIALAAGLLLALTNALTEEPIKAQTALQADAARQSVLPEGEAFTALTEEGADIAVFEGQKDAQTVGYTGMTTAKGYGGEIEVTVGLSTDATVTGINVGGPNFQETAGLGAKAKEESFTEQFRGLDAPIKLGEGVDALTGATITTNAVIGAVNKVAEAIKSDQLGLESEGAPKWWATDEGKIVSVLVQGFAGEIEVQVGLSEDGSIYSVTVGGANFAETEGFGARAKEPEFTQQFIGQSGQIENFDALSGATITSEAVLGAVNTALEFAAGDMGEPSDPGADPAASSEPVATEAPVESAIDDSEAKTASEQGFAGPIEVKLLTDETGAITALEIGGEGFAETDGLGSKVRDAEFIDQFVGQTGPFTLGDGIDGIAGATISSEAAVKAINAALEAEPGAEPEASEEPAPTEAASIGDDALTASEQGFAGPIEVKLTTDEAGAITALEIGGEGFAETDGLGSKVRDAEFIDQFVGQTGPFTLGDGIDGIAGATISSEAAIKAINAALEAEPGAEPEASEEPAPTETASIGDDALTATEQGFAGPIEVKLLTDEAGAITALEIGGEGFAETDGLGSKVRDADFIDQFVGQSGPFTLGDGIDGIAGATISSEAAVKAINAALGLTSTPEAGATATPAPTEAATPEPTPDTGDSATPALVGSDRMLLIAVTEQGFAGPVSVRVHVDMNDLSVSGIGITDEGFAETEGLGARVREGEFMAQFIGQTAPLTIQEDIDSVAGATISSEAVIRAVNAALEFAAIEARTAAQEDGALWTRVDENRFESADSIALAVSEQGFAGSIRVWTFISKGDNTVLAVVIDEANFSETEGIGARALEQEFTAQFAGGSGELAYGEDGLDALSGATVTSEAVLKAVNQALQGGVQ